MKFIKFILLFIFTGLPLLFLGWFLFNPANLTYKVSFDIKTDYSGVMKAQIFYVIDGINQGYNEQYSKIKSIDLNKDEFSHIAFRLGHGDRALKMLRLDLGDNPFGRVTVRNLKVGGYSAFNIKDSSRFDYNDLKIEGASLDSDEVVFQVIGGDPYISSKGPVIGSAESASLVREAWLGVFLKQLSIVLIVFCVVCVIHCYSLGFTPYYKNGITQAGRNRFYIISKIIQIVLIYYWLTFWLSSDSYYSVYLICGAFGAFSVYKSNPAECNYSISKILFVVAMSSLFSLAVILANYHMVSDLVVRTDRTLPTMLHYLLLFAAGFSISYNSLIFIAGSLSHALWKPEKRTTKQIILFAAFCMGIFCAVDISTLFLYNYPGTLTYDSVIQLTQIQQNVYSNHHPFWHTMIIKIFITLGQYIFHDMTAAVAVYSVFQILLISLCFTYSITTMYEAGIPFLVAVFGLLFCALMPYNIIYSFIIWKDILFGGAILVFIVSVYRVIYGIGNKKISIASLFLGGLGATLFRSNGLFVFILSLIAFIVLFRKKYLRMIILFICIVMTGVAMKYPVLKALNVPQPELVESLSIPLQQVGRVIADGKEITPEQKILLGKILDLPAVPKSYTNWLSDPIKQMVTLSGNQNYLVDHKFDYFKVWFRIGVRYPREYIEAWIDQTKGFWHGGYTRLPCEMGVSANYVGVKPNVENAWDDCSRFKYFALFTDGRNSALKPFLSIGFNFWVLMVLFCCNVINDRKTEIFMTIPGIAVTSSLLIATPLYNEFRYVYALSSCLPFAVMCTLYFLNMKRNVHSLSEVTDKANG